MRHRRRCSGDRLATGGSLTAVDRVLRRVHRLPKKVVFGIAAVLGLAVVLMGEARTALVKGVGVMAAGLLGLAIAGRGLSRQIDGDARQDERGVAVGLMAEPRTALVTGVGLMAAGLLGIAIAVRGLRRTLTREAAQDERWAEERHAAEKAAEQEQRKWEKREARHERARRKE